MRTGSSADMQPGSRPGDKSKVVGAHSGAALHGAGEAEDLTEVGSGVVPVVEDDRMFEVELPVRGPLIAQQPAGVRTVVDAHILARSFGAACRIRAHERVSLPFSPRSAVPDPLWLDHSSSFSLSQPQSQLQLQRALVPVVLARHVPARASHVHAAQQVTVLALAAPSPPPPSPQLVPPRQYSESESGRATDSRPLLAGRHLALPCQRLAIERVSLHQAAQPAY